MNTINPYKLFIACNVPNWLMQSDVVSQGAKLCYGRLCQYSGADGRCFPKKTTLAKDLGVTRSGAWKYIDELKKALLIEEKDGHFVFLSHELMSGKCFLQETNVSVGKQKFPTGNAYIRRESIRESIREGDKEQEPKPETKNQTPLLVTNYFFSKYKERYKTNYPADRGRFIKALKNIESDLPFESFKTMIDKFIDGGGDDMQKFIWAMPKLATTIVKKPIVDGFARYNDPNYRLDA